MRTCLQAILAVVAVAVAPGADEGKPAPTETDASSIVLISGPVRTAPGPASSAAIAPAPSGVSAAILSRMPKYAPSDLAGGAGVSGTDLRDVDRPRNRIPRIPLRMMQEFVVRAPRLPDFQKYDLLTPEGLIDLSFKEHPGLRLGNIFNLNAPAARARIMNEKLYAARSDLTDTVFAMAAGGDPEEARLMQKAIVEESFFTNWPGKVDP